MLLGFRKIFFRHRKPRLRDSSLQTRLVQLLVVLCGILLLHTVAMVQLEGMSISDAVWLTLTSATTVGYGDLSAATPWGRAATIILLYIGGIAILAQVAALYFEQRQEVRQRMLTGDWSWKMDNHIVFLNCPQEVDEHYFYRAISGLRDSHTSLAKLPIIIVSENFNHGLPDRLRKLNVMHVSKPTESTDALESAAVEQAHTVVVLSHNHLDAQSDSINFDLVDRLREMGVQGRIIAEVVKDTNRNRLKKAGADNVLRPIRAYPELLVRAILAPGSEQVIETLFDSYGEECIRYAVKAQATWGDIIRGFVAQDLGIPIAYADTQGQIINNPSSKQEVDTSAIFVVARQDTVVNDSVIQSLLDGLAEAA